MLFISHDLNIVRFISDRTMVMYRGKVVESGETEELFSHPLHPYTKLLMLTSNDQERETERQGGDSKDGCAFLERCSERKEMCAESIPELKGSSSHRVACFVYPE